MYDREFALLREKLRIERPAIIALGEGPYSEEAFLTLISLIRCYHTDQHSRILAIEAVEKLTGEDIGDIPKAKCKFVDRLIRRRIAENAK